MWRSVRLSPLLTSTLTIPFSRADRKLKFPTGVTRTSQSRGRKAASPWNRETEKITSWMKEICSPRPKNSSLPGF